MTKRVIAAAVVTSASQVFAQASFAPIPPLSPLTPMFTVGLSGDGLTAVGTSNYFDNARAISYRGGVTSVRPDLRTPQTPNPVGHAYAVSRDGSIIVGTSRINSVDQRATVWNNGTPSLLPAPAGVPVSFSNAWGVSSDGTTAVGVAGFGSTTYRAVRWNNGVATDLGGLAAYPLHEAFAASADGSYVAGYSFPSESLSTLGSGWVWHNGAVMQQPAPQGAFGVQPIAISADGGTVAANVRTTPGNASIEQEAYVWRNGVPMSLGLPSGPVPQSFVNALSADGRVAVGWGATEPVGSGFAFIWDEQHGLQDLNQMLVSLGVDLHGWHLEHAYGISADGLTITGSGTDASGLTGSWIAVVPSPSELVTLTSIGIIAARRRRGRRWLEAH